MEVGSLTRKKWLGIMFICFSFPGLLFAANLYKDKIDEGIKKELHRLWKKSQPEVKIIMSSQDLSYVKEMIIDERIGQLLNYLVGQKGHRLAVRIKWGYDDEQHALSRESEYPKGVTPNVSAHFNAQAVDIFIADGVEMSWQVSSQKSQRQKAQDKIRKLIREMLDLGSKKEMLLPTQILVYRYEDARYFSKDIYRLYGKTQAERGRSGILYSSRMWDRLHIGY
jgi:hypothetical protein